MKLPCQQCCQPDDRCWIRLNIKRVRHGISYHGVALNVKPDLSHFQGIVPCGIREFGVTSLAEMGKEAGLSDVDRVLQKEFAHYF